MLCHTQRRRQVEPPVIKRPAGNHTFDPLARELHQRVDIGEILDPAAGDYRNLHLPRQAHGRVDIDALEQSVATDIGKQQAGNRRLNSRKSKDVSISGQFKHYVMEILREFFFSRTGSK